ncbi:MAG: SRPBCC domain-containing protein [Ignavibacteria bacterium]|nr:SRPBCC domain-containing protein [Ignavibacteria bacterium]
MNRNTFDLSEFRHSILLSLSSEDVYGFIASSQGICSWFIGEAEFTQPAGRFRLPNENASAGDIFRWKWLGKNLQIEGEVLYSVEGEVFEFTFGKSFIVSVTLKEQNGRTLFTLHQSYRDGVQKDDFAHINCCVCWVFFMTNLKSVAEHGIDLRETLADDDSLVNR